MPNPSKVPFASSTSTWLSSHLQECAFRKSEEVKKRLQLKFTKQFVSLVELSFTGLQLVVPNNGFDAPVVQVESVALFSFTLLKTKVGNTSTEFFFGMQIPPLLLSGKAFEFTANPISCFCLFWVNFL